MKARGFTLVELLAVISILAIILVIAYPLITGVIENSKQNSYDSQVKLFENSARLYINTREYLLPNEVSESTEVTLQTLYDENYLNNIPENTKTGEIFDSTSYVLIIKVGEKDYTYSFVEVIPTINADVSGANEPILPTNMIPVYYDYTADVWKKADTSNAEGDNQWFDYENSIWANGVMVKSTTRDTYLAAEAGTEVDIYDVLQFYVWIPRYKYRIEDANFHKYTQGLVGVVFESGTESTGNAIVNSSTGFEDGEYLTHPAFCVTNNDDNSDGNWSTYLGDDCDDPDDWNLTGFWVGKFETSYVGNKYTIVPTLSDPNNYAEANAYAYATQFYDRAKDLNESGNVFGLTESDDTHMLNNKEWGAVSYLANSDYGRGSDPVWINPSTNQLVGCVGTSAQSYYYNGYNVCQYEYNDETYGGESSTTGNVSGVYDMAGGVEEYTAGTKRISNPFNASIYNDRHTKYAEDLGETNGAWTLDMTIGMGFWETGSANNGYYTWNRDRALWYWSTYSNYPVFARGNKALSYQYAGIYSYRIFYGSNDYDIGWRAALVVEQ